MKTILVLEDELALLSLLHHVLGRHGYTILEASSAEQAFREFNRSDRQIDLLIADVSLPGISGVQVALVLRLEAPDLRVILTSGYPSSAWSVRDSANLRRLGSESVNVLLKPFASQALLNMIVELIGAPFEAMGASPS